MASAAIPIHKIRVDSTLSTFLSRSSAVPSIIRKPLKMWLFWQVLRLIISTLSGEALGRLTAEEARDLYSPLNQLYIELHTILEAWSRRPWLQRKLMAWWTRPIARETEKLGSIIETLAWGSDEQLREFIDSAVDAIEVNA